MSKIKPKVKLFAPPQYWGLQPVQKREICNGCGPKALEFMVPDNLLGLDIEECCNIHDFMYAKCMPIAEKTRRACDRAFLNNMLRTIKAHTKWRWLRWLRRRKARIYYLAVKNFGGPSYWCSKNKDSEMKFV